MQKADEHCTPLNTRRRSATQQAARRLGGKRLALALKAVGAVQEDGQAGGQRSAKELGEDVEEGQAHVAHEHAGGADGTGGVQRGTGVGAACGE